MQEKYSIGEVAAMLEVSTRTLRFYDEKGLVKPAYTEENGYRFYEKEQIDKADRINFVSKRSWLFVETNKNAHSR